jgi:hypothetical protein
MDGRIPKRFKAWIDSVVPEVATMREIARIPMRQAAKSGSGK